MHINRAIVIIPSPEVRYVFSNGSRKLEYDSKYFDRVYDVIEHAVLDHDRNIVCSRSYSSATQLTSELIKDIATADVAIVVVTARSSNVFWQLETGKGVRAEWH